MNMHTRGKQNSRRSDSSSTINSTLRQRGLNSNIPKIGTANFLRIRCCCRLRCIVRHTTVALLCVAVLVVVDLSRGREQG